jgi:hypothetical protein
MLPYVTVASYMYTSQNLSRRYNNFCHKQEFSFVKFKGPVAVAERSEAWTIFDRSEAVITGSNPALGMDI